MMTKLGRIIPSKRRINQIQVQDHHLPQRRPARVRAPNPVDAHRAASVDEEKAKIKTDLNPAGELTLQNRERVVAEIKAKIIALNALRSSGINVHTARKIASAVMYLWMRTTSASAMHGKQNVIAKADCHMHNHQQESKDQS